VRSLWNLEKLIAKILPDCTSCSHRLGLAFFSQEGVESRRHGNRTDRHRLSYSCNDRDQRFALGMEAASTGIWPTPIIDLHHLGAANFCDGLLHRGLRACRRFLVKPGSSAYFPGGDCDRRPDVVDEQPGRVILPRAGPQNLGPVTYLIG
jgi:hypothetical protein